MLRKNLCDQDESDDASTSKEAYLINARRKSKEERKALQLEKKNLEKQQRDLREKAAISRARRGLQAWHVTTEADDEIVRPSTSNGTMTGIVETVFSSTATPMPSKSSLTPKQSTFTVTPIRPIKLRRDSVTSQSHGSEEAPERQSTNKIRRKKH